MAFQGGIADNLDTDLFRQERQERLSSRLFAYRARPNISATTQHRNSATTTADGSERNHSHWKNRILPRWKRKNLKPEDGRNEVHVDGVEVEPVGAETEALLSDLPDNWSNPRPTYRVLSEATRSKSRILAMITDPRAVRAMRMFLFGIPAFYLSVFDSALGTPATMIGIIYFSESMLDVAGMMTNMIFVFVTILMVTAFAVSSLLLMALMAADGYGLLIFTYIALTTMLGLGMVGPLGGLGRTFASLTLVITTVLFWKLFPFGDTGVVILIPWDDVTKFLEERVLGAGYDELLQDGGLLSIQAILTTLTAQIQSAVGTITIPVIIPPGYPLSGNEIDVTIIPGTSIEFNLIPGMWLVTDIVWGSHNGIITSLGSTLLQVLTGHLIYLASFIPPPYTSLLAEVRLAQGRVLQTIIYLTTLTTDAREARQNSTDPTADSHSTGDTEAANIKKLLGAESRDVTLSLGQSALEQLEAAAAKIKMSIMVEPAWLSPNIMARPHAALGSVNAKLTALTTEILLQSLHLFDRDADSRSLDSRFSAGFLELRRAGLRLLDLCGQGICLVPKSSKRAQVQGIAEQILEAEKALKGTHQSFQEGCKRLTERAMRNAVTEVEAQSILKEAGVRDTEASMAFFYYPLYLSAAIRELLDAEYRYSVLNAIVSLFTLFFGFGLASALSFVLQTLKLILSLPKLLRRSSWVGSSAWWANKDTHAVFKNTLALLIVFLLPLYWVEYRTWIWPEKETQSTSTSYLQTAPPNNFEAWVVLTFVICYFPTLESTVHKAFARVVGATLGCLLGWLAVWSSDGNGWGIVFWLCSVLAFVAYMAASGADSLIWMSPAWGYMWNATQINLVVVALDYWKARDTRTVENFVLSRFMGTVLGALLAIFISVCILPMGSGINARFMCIDTYKSFSNALKDAVHALANQTEKEHQINEVADRNESPSATAGVSDTNLVDTVEKSEDTSKAKMGFLAKFWKPKGESAAGAELDNTVEEITPQPMIYESAKAEVVKGKAQLATATDLLKQSVVMSDGPVVCTDGRLYDLRLHLATLQYIAGAVDIADADFSSISAATAENVGAKTNTSGQLESSVALGEVGSEDPKTESASSQLNLTIQTTDRRILNHRKIDSPSKTSTASVIHNSESLRRCPFVIDLERLRDIETVLERCANELTGVLLSQSTMDVTDSPLVSRLIFDAEARDNQDAALRALQDLPNHGSGADQSVTASLASMCLRIRRPSVADQDAEKDASSSSNEPLDRDYLIAQIDGMYDVETIQKTILALSLSRFAVFSALIINAIYHREPEHKIPVLQRALTIQNYQSRRFLKMEAEAKK